MEKRYYQDITLRDEYAKLAWQCILNEATKAWNKHCKTGSDYYLKKADSLQLVANMLFEAIQGYDCNVKVKK